MNIFKLLTSPFVFPIKRFAKTGVGRCRTAEEKINHVVQELQGMHLNTDIDLKKLQETIKKVQSYRVLLSSKKGNLESTKKQFDNGTVSKRLLDSAERDVKNLEKEINKDLQQLNIYKLTIRRLLDNNPYPMREDFNKLMLKLHDNLATFFVSMKRLTR